MDRLSFTAKGTEVCREEALTGLANVMARRGPGLYIIKLNAARSWFRRLLAGSLSSTGHVVEAEISERRFRFMDAKTGLWACDSHNMLVDMTKEHLSEFYNAMFSGGSFTLWKY